MQLPLWDIVPADYCSVTSITGLSKTPGAIPGEKMDFIKSQS